MKDSQEISVSVLKAKLLEVVRDVQKGKAFRITKAGKPVALLSPTFQGDISAVGFAKVKVLGDVVEDLNEAWSFDEENLPARK